MNLPQWQLDEIKHEGWLAVVRVVAMFFTVAALLFALNLFFPRDLLPYKCTTIHQLAQEKLKI